MPRSPGVAVVALAVFAVSLFAPAATAPAAAAGAGACTDPAGVTVVVDFGPLGGTEIRCAGTGHGNGLEALGAAGFSYSFVPGKGPFVCAVSGRPDPCNGAPPDAYWSYWSASRGGSWTYNNSGAHIVAPRPGSVEGWAFGAGNRPATAPPAALPTTTRPPATQPPATQPPAPSRPAATSAPDRPAAPPAAASPGERGEVSDAPDGTTRTTGGGDSAGDDSGRGSGGDQDGADGRTSDDSGGSPVEDRDAGDGDAGDGDAGDGSDGDQGAGDGAEQLATEETSTSSGPGIASLLALAGAAAIIVSAVWELRRRRTPR